MADSERAGVKNALSILNKAGSAWVALRCLAEWCPLTLITLSTLPVSVTVLRLGSRELALEQLGLIKAVPA